MRKKSAVKRFKIKLVNLVWCLMHPVVWWVSGSAELSAKYPDIAEKWYNNPVSYMLNY